MIDFLITKYEKMAASYLEEAEKLRKMKADQAKDKDKHLFDIVINDFK